MSIENRLVNKGILLRAAVWGQSFGILVFATLLAIEDAPSVFARVSPFGFILPIAASFAALSPRVIRYLTRSLSVAMLVILILIPSVSTAVGAIAFALQAYDIPEFLVTNGWKYTRLTSLGVAGIFSLALVLNICLSVRVAKAEQLHRDATVEHEAGD